MTTLYKLQSLKGNNITMSQKHPHRKPVERVCPKCGATEGVSRILNYYFCESCHKKQEAEKGNTPVVHPPVSPR